MMHSVVYRLSNLINPLMEVIKLSEELTSVSTEVKIIIKKNIHDADVAYDVEGRTRPDRIFHLNYRMT